MSISITSNAANKVLEIAKAEGLENSILRVKIVGQGCAGFAYDLFFDDSEPGEMDEIFESNGIKICIDSLSLQYLDGTEIDYLDKGLVGSGFKFNNPNTTGTCGCGSSFSV